MKQTNPRNPDARSIVQLEDFRAAYNGRTVVEKLTFDIKAGEVFVIGGGSGCGKSTVLKHIIGLYEPAGGRILIDGMDICTPSAKERKQILRKFGVAFQSGALFGDMSVLRNVELPLLEYT